MVVDPIPIPPSISFILPSLYHIASRRVAPVPMTVVKATHSRKLRKGRLVLLPHDQLQSSSVIIMHDAVR